MRRREMWLQRLKAHWFRRILACLKVCLKRIFSFATVVCLALGQAISRPAEVGSRPPIQWKRERVALSSEDCLPAA